MSDLADKLGYEPTAADRAEDAKLQRGEGIKYDGDKIRFDLLPFHALEKVAWIASQGAKKYADENWRKVRPGSRYVAAALRHLVAFMQGEDCDQDPLTGNHHLAHVAINAMFALELELVEGVSCRVGDRERVAAREARS